MSNKKGYSLPKSDKKDKKKMVIETFNPIGTVRKVIGYGLIGIGVATLPLPTGSQAMIIGGALLLGIPIKVTVAYTKFYSKEVYFSIKRFIFNSKYEIRRIFL